MTARVVFRRVAAIAFLLFLAFQVGIPAAQFNQPRPSRFGWQMYSGVRPVPRFWVVFANGESREVAVSEVLSHPRNDQTDYEKVIVPQLFQLHPDAVRVRVKPSEASEYREYP